ncbi:MAG: serine hydrolase [Deltaproteobacteria bacterium]|nr:serine hydrolase [Deltaproteobacteria bacterium]
MKPRPGFGFISWATGFSVDRINQETSATIFGGFKRRAAYRKGRGCLLLPDNGNLPERYAIEIHGGEFGTVLPDIADGIEPVTPISARLSAAMDEAFEEPASGEPRMTRAIVVIHHGRVVAEKYASGIQTNTPLLGYSMAKSVMNALAGILVRQGRLDVNAVTQLREWSGDERSRITVDHLMRMTSGLDLGESGSPYSPVARMMYLEPDMAAYARSAPLDCEPGKSWSYTSGNTLILSGILKDRAGGDLAAFAQQELFSPLGMKTAVLESDAAGTPVGSTYLLASARDWAKFGLLYLHDGVVSGQRILPEGWVEYSTRPTLGTGYGAGFWINGLDGDIPFTTVPWSIPKAPRGSFYAKGMLGQYLIVIPECDLVIVRMGASHGRNGEIESVSKFLSHVIAALR